MLAGRNRWSTCVYRSGDECRLQGGTRMEQWLKETLMIGVVLQSGRRDGASSDEGGS